MALIKTVSPEQAEGKMKEAFDMFIENLGVIPKPLEMMSASPAIFDQQLQRIQYLQSSNPQFCAPVSYPLSGRL